MLVFPLAYMKLQEVFSVLLSASTAFCDKTGFCIGRAVMALLFFLVTKPHLIHYQFLG